MTPALGRSKRRRALAAVTASARRCASARTTRWPSGSHAVIAAALVVERGVGPLVGLLHHSGGEHALQAAIERAGAELQGVIGLARHVLHDAVPVTLLAGQRQQDVEDRRGERKQILRDGGLLINTSVTDILELNGNFCQEGSTWTGLSRFGGNGCLPCRGQTGDRQRISGKRRRKFMSVPSLRHPCMMAGCHTDC